MGEEAFPPIPADETQLYIFSLSQPLKPVVTPNCGTTFFLFFIRVPSFYRITH